MRWTGIVWLGLVVSFVGCSSSSTSSSSGRSAALQDFLTRCKAATDLACQKGFDCDNLFVTSNYNSVEHCQHEVDTSYESSASNLSEAQLSDCADTCDIMRRDVEQLTCQDFSQAVFNDYSCG